VRERQIEVARVTVVQGVWYAEAGKRVVEEPGYRVRDPERIPVRDQETVMGRIFASARWAFYHL
jgi:hypothetical protein